LAGVLTLSMFVFVMNGCSGVETIPLPISDENQYFENGEFSVYYPQGWNAIPQENGDIFFGDYNYRPYCFIVNVNDDTNVVSDILNRRPTSTMRTIKKNLSERGFLNISCSDRHTIFDGKLAEEGHCRGEKDYKYQEDSWITVAINNSQAGNIYVSYWFNFDEKIRNRLRGVINSTHFK